MPRLRLQGSLDSDGKIAAVGPISQDPGPVESITSFYDGYGLMSRPVTQDHTETVEGDRFQSELAGAHCRGEETLGLIYKAFVFRIFQYCVRLGLSEPDAEDASHEVVLRVNRALATFRFGEPIWPWIASITRNYITDEWRKAKRLQPLDTVIDLSDTLSFEEEVLRRGRIRLMHQSLAELSLIDRTMIVMRDLQGFSYREICGALGLSLPAVKTKLYRARRTLGAEVTRQRRMDPTLPSIFGWRWLKSNLARLTTSAKTGFSALALGALLGGSTFLLLPPDPPAPPAGQSLYNLAERLADPLKNEQMLTGASAKTAHSNRDPAQEQRRITSPGFSAIMPIKDPNHEDSDVRINLGPITLRCEGLSAAELIKSGCDRLASEIAR